MGLINFHFFALAALGEGLSGGDRIFIEFARRWCKKFPITIYVWEEGYQMCLRHKLQITNVKFQISNMESWKRFGFIINYFARIVEGIRLGLTFRIKDPQNTIVYSASEFWMDVFPAVILKLRFPKIKWMAAWYQTAQNPLKGFRTSLFYWLSQVLIKPLITRFTDFILVNNESEKNNFLEKNRLGKVIAVYGGVNLSEIEKYKTQNKNLPKTYDAVFQGRLHPQKGVLELIDIWKLVVDKKPQAKLAIVGDGPLMRNLKFKIKNLKLESNIQLFGYVFDGPEKYKIFSQSKIVVHPAYYDSGGMAAAEAMAFGLPCIGFDLKAYLSYYPKGMVKVNLGDKIAFANAIIKFLEDQKLVERIGKEALDMIRKDWSWDKRAESIIKFMDKSSLKLYTPQ